MRRYLILIGFGLLLGFLLSGVLLYLLPTFNFFLGPSDYLILIFIAGIFVLLLSQKQLLDAKKKTNELLYTQHFFKKKFLEQKNRFETIFHQSSIGIALLNSDGYFIKVNESFCLLFGYDSDELLKMSFYALFNGTEIGNVRIHVQGLLDNKIETYRAEQRCIRKNGETLWVSFTLYLTHNKKGKHRHFIFQTQDITLQKNAEERLRHMAYHDALTGLANRNKLEQFIDNMLATARRHQQGFALLFLDLDRFKNVNDTIGHEAGDRVLQIIGDRLIRSVRSNDIVARLGGDEFILLVTDVKSSNAVAVIAQKILNTVLKVMMINGHEIYITVSIGISVYPFDGENMQDLMKHADLALYRAKDHGYNNYQFYTNEMTNKAKQKMLLQNALGHALVKNEFLLNYQPKMNLSTRSITGIEAFIRWKNTKYKMITPREMINLAEETGLIIPVSEWVLKTACLQLKTWHALGLTSLTMAVNCSARQLKQVAFVTKLGNMIDENHLLPSMIELEVTETMIMQDIENMLRVLYSLKDLGIKITIDDFGTGYWSLSNLRRISVDKIKIDSSFIRQITLDESCAALTKAIIAMVNKLGLTSIAEGVETKEQYDFLAQEGCKEIQGYYLTKPLPEDAMTEFLKHPIPNAESRLLDNKVPTSEHR